ncbi:hypothetical protein N7466_000176 [Penicillium verhagenii]|uniref:uncharacterized protein n=1 Tax=Penicillium verhagenii TaxID=1562060 RepID=UPI0025457D28|nr:uncharacterized protein N7466_000176 [Penicillium verhagenii]KAJ5947161.1 hypothetical protein N7466_000176 [Penicillium verhagenii]
MSDSVDDCHKDALGRLEAAIPQFEEAMKMAKAPSISVGVLYDGEIIFTKSIGLRDIGRKLEANSNTSYLLASCSKMFTSSALNILQSEDKLSLTDTIQKHLPNFDPVEDPEIGKNAALIDAGRHSTGLANPNVIYMGPDGILSNTAENHVSMVNALPTSNDLGQRFQSWWYYSNATFGLLAKVIEAVSEIPFANFLKERILEPLGLRQTLLFEYDVENNSNIAYPYAIQSDGSWVRIETQVTSENHSPVLGSQGIRSSVNDMLGFFAAVINRHDELKDKSLRTPLLPEAAFNPLGHITDLWNHYWTRPIDDGFPNGRAYTLGWSRSTLSTAGLGLNSTNCYTISKDPDSQTTLGRDSEPCTAYGHNGNANGSTASAYVFPDSHAAVVAFSNVSYECDAAEAATRILVQALFDLKPHVDCISALREARDRGFEEREKTVKEWEEHRDVSKYTSTPDDFLESYVGLNTTSRISIIRSDTASAKVAVKFGNNETGIFELEPYNADALSFLPSNTDIWLARGMIDWDYYAVGVYEFVRDENGEVVALWWQWEETDWPGLWVRQKEGMSEKDVQGVIGKFGRFRKPKTIGETDAADAPTADLDNLSISETK